MSAFRVLASVLLAAGLITVPTQTAKADPGGWVGPLSTRGRYVVDARGERFKLKSGNWHGASGTWNGSGDIADPANHHEGEKAEQIPLGLDRAGLDEIISSFAELGLNSVRLPFSNQMIHETRPVSNVKDAALRGKTPLQIYDAVVRRLTERGFAVILNNHTNTSRWCCAVDGNERWNASQSAQQWEDDWQFMVRRYRDDKRVVGADLYNEVRRTVWDDPNWGQGNQFDWQRAAQLAGDRILTEANPDLLIIVEGINWTGVPVDGLPHGRPTLEPLRTLSHTLVDSGKLVYSAHFYGNTGPNHTAGRDARPALPGPDRDRTARRGVPAGVVLRTGTEPALHRAGVDQRVRRRRTGQHRPALSRLVRELHRLPDPDRRGLRLLAIGRLPHQPNGQRLALMAWDASGSRMGLFDGDDWRAAAWTRLVGAQGKTGQVERADRWSMLTTDFADFTQSRRTRALPDWDSGARKASCPDGQRLIGLSHTGNRGLCTDAGNSPGWDTTLVVRDESFVDQDWASGYTKVQCPPDQFLIGYSARGAAFSATLCARSRTTLGRTGRTVWFDRSDNRPAIGGDFASGRYKGQCAVDEYLAGVAYNGRFGSARTPDALLCRK